MENLLEGLQREMNRVREIIKDYEKICPDAGRMAIWMMNNDLKRSEKAISEGDTIQMMICYRLLNEYQE